MHKFSIFLLLSLFALCGVLNAQYENEYDVPFVPSNMQIVEKMLSLAHVDENDVLYDLGCGDGRIVITASKIFGIRGVGIDIDPARISESNENAHNEGVEDKVRFIEQDLFEADISEATVVSMYLLPSVNLRLRPKLFRELEPGTRIVSHDFNMGEWDPDNYINMSGEMDDFESFSNFSVYFWVLPANVSGSWTWSENEEDGSTFTINIEQKFQNINGSFGPENQDLTVSNLSITGKKLQFTVNSDDNETISSRLYIGTVEGNILKGTIISKTGSSFETIDWKATRKPSTAITIYE